MRKDRDNSVHSNSHTNLFLGRDLQQELNAPLQVLQIFNRLFRGVADGRIRREGLLKDDVQLFDVHPGKQQ